MLSLLFSGVKRLAACGSVGARLSAMMIIYLLSDQHEIPPSLRQSAFSPDSLIYESLVSVNSSFPSRQLSFTKQAQDGRERAR